MEDTGISSIDIDALMSETKPTVCSAKRSVFVFTYKSDADLSPELLQTMTAKSVLFNSDDEEDTEPVTDASYREAIMDAIEMMVGKLHPRKKPTPAAARPAPTVPASESVAATAESTS